MSLPIADASSVRPAAPAVLLEAFVTTLAAAHAAGAAGADRLELCGAGDGGLTPARDVLAAVCASVHVPVHVMCRPHARGFTYSAADDRDVRAAIAAAGAAGAAGVVLGAALDDGALDVRRLAAWIAEARPMRVVVHRVFDGVPDPGAAMGALEALGADEVLTSGGAATAWEGRAVLARLAARGEARRAAGAPPVAVIAGGGVRGDHVAALVAATGVRAVHARGDDARVIAALRRALPAPAPHA